MKLEEKARRYIDRVLEADDPVVEAKTIARDYDQSSILNHLQLAAYGQVCRILYDREADLVIQLRQTFGLTQEKQAQRLCVSFPIITLGKMSTPSRHLWHRKIHGERLFYNGSEEIPTL